ncbi:hypothetical protein IWX85_001945 [Polaromonas sp. CG_9.11]|nr:hypothetical protein [Polaromonas sp. CG_9.11]
MRQAAPAPWTSACKGTVCHAQHQLRAQHAFTAHHAHFHARTAVYQCDQRNVALRREINMAGRFPGLAQHLGQHQFDRLAKRQEAAAVSHGKQFNQVIFKGIYAGSRGVADPSRKGANSKPRS